MGTCVAEIRIIAEILRKEKLCSDISPLTNGYKKGEWNVVKLKFNINPIPKNTKPSLSLLYVYLDVAYSESIATDIPISKYCFRVTAVGQNQEGIFKSSWHLDHDNNNGQDYIHPHFHMTWGGDSIKDISLGNVLLLPTPRISHPPMDIVLGIDFILSNFVEAQRYEPLKDRNPQYRAAVRRAQEKYWKPYMLSLAHHWCKNYCSQTQYNTINAKYFHPTLMD